MKNKISLLIKRHWLLFFFLIGFTFFILPVSFQNNDNLNVILSEHVDSGSILGSILQMDNDKTPRSFYNQNIPYHTGYYGFLFNSIIFWTLFLVKITFNLTFNNNFYIFALVTKITIFITSLLSIIFLYKLSQKIFKNKISVFILLSLFLIFPEFLHYTFHIKSDILGLLLSIISLNYLYNYLINTKNTKTIIKANVFGALSILCKQPHIFIIFPLFIGFIFSLKGTFKNKLFKFIKIYFYSGVIFTLLFFIIHPYAFIEPKNFISRQIALTGMTSSNYIDNIKVWFSSYTSNTLLSITVFTPFLFLILNLFKKFRNKKNYFLSLIAIYIITYLIWLTLKVGPMRFIAYLIPILPFSILLFSQIINIILKRIKITKKRFTKILYLLLIILLILLSIKSIKTNLPVIQKKINSAYMYKKSNTYQSTKEFENKFKNDNLSEKSTIYSVSLPVNINFYKSSLNTWQFTTEESIKNFKPDYLFIDFTVYWEKPYDHWKKIANQNNLKKEVFFIKNIEKEKNIVLFYK